MNYRQARLRFISLDKQQRKYEKTWLPKIMQAQADQIEPLAEMVRQQGAIYALSKLDAIVQAQPMYYVLNNLYITVGTQSANDEYGFIRTTWGQEMGLKSVKAFGFNDIWASIMDAYFQTVGAAKVQKITETLRDKLRAILVNSANDQNIDNFLLARQLLAPEIRLPRARAIARTETANAAAKGAENTANASTLLMIKQWMSVKDFRSRQQPRDSTDHLTMDGKTTEMNGTFLVPNKKGPNLMTRPHDPDAPPEQVVNCRCKVIYVPQRDARGRLIRVPSLIPAVTMR